VKLDGEFTVHAPIEEVWRLFLDTERLCTVVPGCEGVKQLDATHGEAVLAVKVQFTTIRSRARVTLLEADEPTHLVAEMVGEPIAMAGAFRARLTADLTRLDPGTRVRYVWDVTLLGRLASLGEAIVRMTAKRLTTQFTENVTRLFESSGAST
jgi:carbon monoxide dehydrogenase subunit G